MSFEQTSSERSLLTQMLNTKALLGRAVSDTPEPGSAAGNSDPLVFAFSGGRAQARPVHLDPALSVSLEQHPLDAAFEILMKDVRAARDRLLALNPGRRTAIERRLEFIARKVARLRGERLNRSLSLTDILRESYREVDPNRTLGLAAWECFIAEAALFQLLEIFFLKYLHILGWRAFEDADLGRLNFAIHSFLQNHAQGFAHDKHCWNFVRSNLYSWYVPSAQAQTQLAAALAKLSSPPALYGWSDHEIKNWLRETAFRPQFRHLDFETEKSVSEFCSSVFEKLGLSYFSSFHGEALCKKTFLPTLELGAFPLHLIETLLSKFAGVCTDICADASHLSRGIWACESEIFEISYTEMMGLLCVLRHLRECAPERTRLPQILHIAPLMAIELHNLEQLPLGGADVSRLHQGTAGQIQQIEGFDQALVFDQIDRSKSTRWLKALAEQLPHWRGLLSNSSNLNWGELHLNLAISKLKDNGYCVYMSHRALPDSNDGERLRKALLGMAALEYFVELPENQLGTYRYLYVFRRVHNKSERDAHRPRFGKFHGTNVDFSNLEDASATQAELAERGWDHLFVRGAAPLVRHLNQKFPKLFQLASIQTWTAESLHGLFSGPSIKDIALEVAKTEPSSAKTLQFLPLAKAPEPGKMLVFPHNPTDLPWIAALLNSSAAQFWVRHQLFGQIAGKQPRLHELKSAPIVDLSSVPAEPVHAALQWLDAAKPALAALQAWSASAVGVEEKQARFVAMSKKVYALKKTSERYRALLNPDESEEFRLLPEAIPQFYPAALLSRLRDCPEIRAHFADRHKTPLSPENWILSDVRSVSQGDLAFIIIQARQGPVIQLSVPAQLKGYVVAQARGLKDHLWSEALQLLKIPRDLSLFIAQTSEIIRVVRELALEIRGFELVLDGLGHDLFEIPADLREFLCQI